MSRKAKFQDREEQTRQERLHSSAGSAESQAGRTSTEIVSFKSAAIKLISILDKSKFTLFELKMNF